MTGDREELGTVALEEAVGLAFGLLKGIMVVLVALFLASGLFTVSSHEVAFVRRLGVLDETPRQPGLHWGWPVVDEPVQVERRTTSRTLDTFDLAREGLELEGPKRQGGLDPRRDGYLLTGDANLLHTTLAARVVPQAPFHRTLTTAADPAALLDVLLEDAVVEVAAGRSVQALLTGRSAFREAVKRTLQRSLDEAEAGLEVQGIDGERDLAPAPPVRAAFDEVAQASQQADRLLSEAQAAASRIESRAHGEAARIVARARADAAEHLATAAADAKRLVALAKRDRRALREQMLAEALGEALREGGEVFLVGEGELRIRLERDASAARADAAREALGGGR